MSIASPPRLLLAAVKFRACRSPRGPASHPPPLASAPARHSGGPAPALPPIHPPPAAGATCAESGSGAGPSPRFGRSSEPRPLRAPPAKTTRSAQAPPAALRACVRPPFPPPDPAAIGACAAPAAPWGRRAGGPSSPPPGVAAAPLCARRAALAELCWARQRPALSDGRSRQWEPSRRAPSQSAPSEGRVLLALNQSAARRGVSGSEREKPLEAWQ